MHRGEFQQTFIYLYSVWQHSAVWSYTVVATATNAVQHSQYRAASNKFFRDNHKSRRHLQVCFCLLAISVQENLANQFLYALFASYSFNHLSFVWQLNYYYLFIYLSLLARKKIIFPQQKASCIRLLQRLVRVRRVQRVAFAEAARECWSDSSRVPQLEHELLLTLMTLSTDERVCEIQLNLYEGKYWDPTPYSLIKSDHCKKKKNGVMLCVALFVHVHYKSIYAIDYTNHYHLLSSINN